MSGSCFAHEATVDLPRSLRCEGGLHRVPQKLAVPPQVKTFLAIGVANFYDTVVVLIVQLLFLP